MKKHWLFTTLVALALCVICFVLCPTEAQAASTSDLTFALNSDGQSYSVTDCDVYASGMLTIPATYNGKPVTSIGDYAFDGCASLTSISIPDSITSIGERAFSGCSSLTSIIIPDSVTCIGSYAFEGCSSLTEITIPDGVTGVGRYTFSDCSSLTNVTIPDSVIGIGNYAFYNCSSLPSITIPDSVTHIAAYAFEGCSSLAEITIPDSVTDIGKHAFRYCSNLTRIWVSENNLNYSSNSNGVLLNKDQTTLIRVPYGLSGSYTIPDSVTVVDSYAFSYCSNLTSVTIPDSITSIGEYAFYDCSSLTEITIPDSVTDIGDFAFCCCSSLISISIGDSWARIGRYTFADCTSLTSITIPDSIVSIGDYAFEYCTGLTNFTIPDSVISMGDYVFLGCSSLTGVTIEDGVRSFGEGVFYNAGLDVVFYRASLYSKNGISFGPYNSVLDNAQWHYNVYADWDVVFADQECRYCPECKDYFFPNGDVALATITFYNWDGTVLESSTYHYGDKVIAPTNPTKAADNIYTYTFKGWDKTVVNCVGNATYTATYAPKYIDYKVTFKNWNGTTVSARTYHYGDKVTVPANPTKSADNTYKYTFAGWDKEIVDCTGDATYTATYVEEYINYTVVFKDWDGTILSTGTYHYGDEVAIPDAPVRGSDTLYYYIFDGWDQAVVNCAGNTTYTATYVREKNDYTVVFRDWDGTVLASNTYHWNDNIIAPADPVKAADNTYTYTFIGWDKIIGACTGDAIYTATYAPTYNNYTVTFVDESGAVLSAKVYHYGDKVIVPADPTKAADNIYSYAFAGWDNAVVDCTGNATYTATYTPIYIDYTVVFKNWDGTVLCSNHYHWGDAVDVPQAPEKEKDHYYIYTFSGWSRDIQNCAGNAEYVANFAAEHYHTYVKSTTFPTCIEQGYTANTCACGDSYKDDFVKETGHSYDNACDTTCNICPYTREASHSYDSGVVTKPATCYETGCKTYTCSVCSTTKNEPIAKTTDHAYDNACDNLCNICGEFRVTKHTYQIFITPATLTQNGSGAEKCSGCGLVSYEYTFARPTSFTLSTTEYTYNGTARTPGVTVKDANSKTLVNGTDYTVTYPSGRTALGTYTVTIKMKGNYSGTKTLTFNINLATPNVTVSNATNGVKITWNAIAGAKNYKVYKSIYSGGKWSAWTAIKTGVTGTTYTDTSVKSNDNVKYTVRAFNGSYSSTYKSSSSIKYLAAPTVTVSNATNGVKITWNAVSGAKNYKVYKSVYSGGKWSAWTAIKTGVTGTSYTDTSVKSNANVKYTVRAFNGNFSSTYKSSSSIKFLATPTVKAANAAKGVTVTWNKIAGAKTYTVYRSVYSGGKWSGWTAIKTGVTGTSYTDTAVKSGATVRYTVKAINGNFRSNVKTGNTTKFLAQPKVTVAKASNGIKASWGKVTGATGYIVYRRTYSGGKWSGWTSIKTTTALSFTDTTAKKGVTYQYTVRAYSGSYKSSFTNSVSIKR